MNWTRGHTLGHGSTATVSAATCRHTGETFALKSTELSKSEFLQNEQKILSTLDSPFIVGYKGYDISMENNKLMFNLMLEYLPDGSIADAIHKRGGRLEESMISCYTRQIVEGLEYLHSSGIVHCDVKGRNILLDEDGAKIADFGCAKWAAPVPRITSREIKKVAVGGTPLFMAPEVARGEDQGLPADIWALGCTIIEMATGGSPWPNATNAASLMYEIGFSGELPEAPDFLSEQATDFLSKCLRRDPQERWTAKQLLNHQFLEGANPNSKQNQEHITSSPTSILDQDIWNSMEEPDNLSDGEIKESSLNSTPAQRLQFLASNSGYPSWNSGETWITIRSSKAVKREDEAMEICGSLTDVDSNGVKLESRNSGDQNSMNFLNQNVSSKSSCGKMILSRCTDDQTVVLSNLNIERVKKRPKLNQIGFL
ncbi:unnamed protein product [Coffea canephora]|uniref:Protein kinase domain-containing protein n=1 Tax=Coffea canephora TaxID=49390 RepID=A0A068UT29_COFCA|nr:unnamed protein product [Coffea canephora]